MAHDDFTDFDPRSLSNSPLVTVSSPCEGMGRFEQHRDGTSRYGDVKVIVAPYSGIHCFRFVWNPIEAALPLSFMRAACLEGVKEALFKALDDGRQVAFVQVTVIDGSYHEVDTDHHSLAVAAYLAVRDALAQAPLVTA